MSLCLAAAEARAWKFEITVNRQCMDADGKTLRGAVSVNGEALGATYENNALRIAAGTYAGKLRSYSPKAHAQGPWGQVGKTGDFLVEIAGAKSPGGRTKTDVLFHGGTKASHVEGCIALGPIDCVGERDEKRHCLGKKLIRGDDHPLRQMRKMFHGLEFPDDTPNATQAADISIVVVEPTSLPKCAPAAAGCKKGLDMCSKSSECCSGCCNGFFNICGKPEPCAHVKGKMCCPI